MHGDGPGPFAPTGDGGPEIGGGLVERLGGCDGMIGRSAEPDEPDASGNVSGCILDLNALEVGLGSAASKLGLTRPADLEEISSICFVRG
jgi:hypothetical protein